MKRYGITVGDNIKLNVRLVDCVGYLVNNAIGYLEDDMPRMVKTPWSTEEIPFEQAAEIGTKKVIQEHSTIGILVTTDGSVTGIEREDYIEPEERVVRELKELNKPFVIVLNSVEPDSEYTQTLAQKLQEKYDTQVIPTDCENLTADKIDEIFGKVLYEFPIERVNISFPRWVDGLPETHWLKEELYDEIKDAFKDIRILKQIDNRITKLQNTEVISTSIINEIQLGTGSINITINLLDDLFYKVLTEISGVPITNEGELFSSMISFANVKKEYDKVSTALQEVNTKGYGIVSPSIDELILEEPEMVKQGTRYGVKLRAKAPSIHMIRADIETDFAMTVEFEGTQVDRIIATTKNICAKGLAFISDKQMNAYTKLDIELFLAGKQINTHAELVYSNPIRINNSFKFLTAVTFTDISKEEMNFITLQCMKYKG